MNDYVSHNCQIFSTSEEIVWNVRNAWVRNLSE